MIVDEPTDMQIVLSAVGNGLASGLSPGVLLVAIQHSYDPWQIDAAVSAAIRLKEIQEEHRRGHPPEGNEVAGRRDREGGASTARLL